MNPPTNYAKDFKELIDFLSERFDKINEQFEKVDQRFDKIDERFEKVDQRFDKIDQRFEKVNQRLITIEEKIEKIEETKADKKDVSNLLTAVDGFAQKADMYFQEMLMLAHKVDRLEKWILEIAQKVGVQLSA